MRTLAIAVLLVAIGQSANANPVADTTAVVIMAAADTLLVHLRRSELSRYVIPSKTMAYLAAGRPILMAMEGAAAAR